MLRDMQHAVRYLVQRSRLVDRQAAALRSLSLQLSPVSTGWVPQNPELGGLGPVGQPTEPRSGG
jgi:hypothetical protein